MKILILELGGSHIECAYSFAHYLQLEGHGVFLCCNEKLVSLYPEKSLLKDLLAVPDTLTGIKQFGTYLRIRKFIRKHKINHLVVNTTEIKPVRNLSFFIPGKTNCTGLVHNAKKLERSSTFVNILSRKMRKYFVPGDYLLSQVKPHALFNVAAFYPVYFPEAKPITVTKPSDEFWVITPGEMNSDRRDYLPLIDGILAGKATGKIKFIFLGNDKMKEEIKPGQRNSVMWQEHIISFNGQVEYNSFHQYITLADIILPLVKIEGDEMYGQSRISGSYNLGLGYHKPFLLPINCKANTDLAPYSLYYGNFNELFTLINSIAGDHTQLEVIKKNYTTGAFGDLTKMAKEVTSFILK